MNNTNSECYAGVWQEWFCGSHIATVERITVQILLILLFLLIIIGNVLTLVAIAVEKQLQTVFNIYIVNLAITDLLVAFSSIPLWLIIEFYGHWPFGKTTCAVLLIVDGAVTYVSNFTLVVMATDRYWAAKWSLHYRNNHNKRKCLMLILLVWVMMLVLYLPFFVSNEESMTDDGYCDMALPSIESVVVLAVLGNHGPFCIVMFCYAHIFGILRRKKSVIPMRSASRLPNNLNDLEITVAAREVSAQGDADNRITETRSQQSRKKAAFRTLSSIVLVYVICIVPYQIYFDISYSAPHLITLGVADAIYLLLYANSAINPILYYLNNMEFRKAYKRLLKCTYRK